MTFRAVRNVGLITLSSIVVLVSILSYGVLHHSAKKLETVITVEEERLNKWRTLMEIAAEAKDSAYEYFMGKNDSATPIMVLIQMAFEAIDEIQESTSDKNELASISEWKHELKVFRQAVHAYANELNEGGTSAMEMEEITLSAANRLVQINRSISKKLSTGITATNKSIMKVTTVSKKILSVILIASIFCTALIGFYMNRALARPINVLVKAVRHIALGDMTEEIEVNSDDEIGELSRSFNHMVRNLRSQKTTLLDQKYYVDSIIANMAEALTVITPEGNIQTVNRATCNLLGYSEDELIGKNINHLFAEDEEENETHDWSNRNHLVTYKAADGNLIPVLFSSSGLKDREGNITGIICVAQDISELKKAEEELRTNSKKLQASNSELQHFLHVASHDLQEPLRKVMVFGDRLKSKYAEALGEQGYDYLERMQRASGRMQTLINDLLTFSRITTKARPFKQVDLAVISQDVLDDLEVRIEETGGSIEIEELPVLDADPVQMRQLFQNIISNALKFSSKDKQPQWHPCCC